MPVTETTENVLEAAELPQIRMYLDQLYTIGVNMYNKADAVGRYFNSLLRLYDVYPAITNTTIKAIIDTMYTDLDLIARNNEMAILSQYNDYCRGINISDAPSNAAPLSVGIWPWKDYWTAFITGYSYTWRYDDDADQYDRRVYSPGLNIPQLPAARKPKMEAIKTLWWPTPPAADVNPGTAIEKWDIAAVPAKTVLDKWWGENSTATNVLKSITEAQREKMKTLIKSTDTLTANTFLFIFHMLIGLCMLSTADQTQAEKLVNTKTPSDSYPNDIFINQLVYMVLMALINPIGKYKWNAEQIKNFLNDILGIIKGDDVASKAIVAAIKESLAIMNADRSYPMHDPNNPDIGFRVRMSDTLNALNEARKTMYV